MKLTQGIRKDLVRDLKPREPIVMPVEGTVRDAIVMMQSKGEGYVIICDQHGKAVGIFTERDVLHRAIGEHVDLDSPVKDLMSTNLASVRETDGVARAFGLMSQRGLRHLPALDDSGVPTGVISIRRVVEYLAEFFPQAVYNLPPESSQAVDSREGA